MHYYIYLYSNLCHSEFFPVSFLNSPVCGFFLLAQSIFSVPSAVQTYLGRSKPWMLALACHMNTKIEQASPEYEIRDLNPQNAAKTT